MFLSGIGVIAGGLLAIQSVLNAGLGQRIGNFGSVLILTLVSVAVLIPLIFIFPSTADLRNLPGFSEWHLYFGGVLGVLILAAPIFLVPRIGTTATLLAVIFGQSLFALIIDHFGWFGSPRIEMNLPRLLGVLLVAAGAYLAGR